MRSLTAILFALAATSALAKPVEMKILVEGVNPGETMPKRSLLCQPTADGKSTDGKNMRPTIAWDQAPEGTESFAVFMMDPDVPADFTDAGKEGKVIAKDAKRQDFFHYGVVNIPATATALNGGLASQPPRYGTELANSLGSYVSKPGMFGGPCPPWNDERLHHYHFIVLALGKDAPIAAPKKARDAAEAAGAKATFARLMESDALLGKATVVGTYSLNPALKPAQ